MDSEMLAQMDDEFTQEEAERAAAVRPTVSPDNTADYTANTVQQENMETTANTTVNGALPDEPPPAVIQFSGFTNEVRSPS